VLATKNPAELVGQLSTFPPTGEVYELQHPIELVDPDQPVTTVAAISNFPVKIGGIQTLRRGGAAHLRRAAPAVKEEARRQAGRPRSGDVRRERPRWQEAATVRQIAEEIGVPRAALYCYLEDPA
jgi:hypothetical protein